MPANNSSFTSATVDLAVVVLSLAIIVSCMLTSTRHALPTSSATSAPSPLATQAALGDSTGPIATWRSASKLIADIQEIVRLARRDGEITIKIKLPAESAAATAGQGIGRDGSPGGYRP